MAGFSVRGASASSRETSLSPVAALWVAGGHRPRPAGPCGRGGSRPCRDARARRRLVRPRN